MLDVKGGEVPLRVYVPASLDLPARGLATVNSKGVLLWFHGALCKPIDGPVFDGRDLPLFLPPFLLLFFPIPSSRCDERRSMFVYVILQPDVDHRSEQELMCLLRRSQGRDVQLWNDQVLMNIGDMTSGGGHREFHQNYVLFTVN